MNNDLYPIGDLQERYGLTSRQAVYDRIKALKIEPAARGKLSSDQLDKLDKLDEHLKSGGTLSDFIEVAIAVGILIYNRPTASVSVMPME